MDRYFLTSESVTIGHPDKMCDYIADSILDEYLKQDKYSRVACEVIVYKNNVLVTGEITSNGDVDIEAVVRNCIKQIGYDNENIGINYANCKIDSVIQKQSNDIAIGVNNGGAGDQGIMYGYATNETLSYMPQTIVWAHELAKRLEYVRKNSIVENLKPDGKTQVTVEYEKDIVKRVECIVISAQHNKDIDLEKFKNDIMDKVILNVIDKKYIDNNTKIYINPTGRFVIGGPLADTGLTGRKIIVDTYGGIAKHGGGAFSGKDATKIDRSGAYMARHIAKNVVANNLADKCEIQLSYVIGIPNAVAINVNCFGTEKIDICKIEERIYKSFDLTLNGIIDKFNLRQPIYSNLSAYGHMGRTDVNTRMGKNYTIIELDNT